MLRYRQVFESLVLTNEPDVALRYSAVAILTALVVVVSNPAFGGEKKGSLRDWL